MPKNTEDTLQKISEKLDDVSSAVHKVDKDLALHKSQFEQHMAQDEKMYEEFRRMNDILQQNTNSLKEHMHRTALLEDLVTKMDKRITPLEKEQIGIDAIKKHKHEQLVKWAKIITVIATLGGMVMWAKPLIIKLLLP